MRRNNRDNSKRTFLFDLRGMVALSRVMKIIFE